jgi:hypothetical protein
MHTRITWNLICAFREASERLLRGDRNAPFPIGSFPPALPFVAG